MKKRIFSLLLCIITIFSLFSGCGEKVSDDRSHYTEPADTVDTENIQDEATALAAVPPALPTYLVPEHGSTKKENSRVSIDYSNTAQGYVMVQVKKDSGKRWKAQVQGPSTTYTYNLTPAQWTVFPLSDGNGNYKVTVYENVSGTKYASVLSLSMKVDLIDEFAPFLYPNQYVNYTPAIKTVKKAISLTEKCKDTLEMVAAVYDYVVGQLSYDKELAATVKSGYLPVLDNVLESKKGICFDYAALMTGMLRSRGVPCKLVVGYAGKAYHAWISVYTEEHGWIDGAIYFDGSAWQRMDPTFASSSGGDPKILEYIGNGSNYTAKYFY